MIVLSGGDVVLPDQILRGASIVVEDDRVAAIRRGTGGSAGSGDLDVSGHYVLPGFVDVHVHGVEGHDTLDGADAIRLIAARLVRYGVTAFCPTSIACPPPALRCMLDAVRRARIEGPSGGSRVLPAHLESNFLNPDYRGAQPLACLRAPRDAGRPAGSTFAGREILDVIAAARPDVGIVTLAPELPGGLDLVRDLVAGGHRVSLGHSAATYEQAIEAIAAGATRATHLFNRMPPVGHRAPGLAGAALDRDDIVAEIVCDGAHVHPSMVRVAVAAKQPSAVMAITDGTAGSGFPRGTVASLGGRRITVGEVATLDDGTIAGSVLTMDRAFSNLVSMMGFSLVDAAAMCSTTPASSLGLHGFGAIGEGAVADLVVLDRQLRVVHTMVGGVLVWSAGEPRHRAVSHPSENQGHEPGPHH